MRTHRQPKLTCAGCKCQSGGVKKAHRSHATIVKSITPIPINMPPTKIVNKLASILLLYLGFDKLRKLIDCWGYRQRMSEKANAVL